MSNTRIKVPREVKQWEAEGLLCAGGVAPSQHYRQCIREGSSEKFALDLVALALGKASMGTGITDDVYIADQNRHGRTILDRMGGNERMVDRLAKALWKKHGYRLKPTDHYVESVARYTGDIDAVVTHGKGLADLKRNLKRQGRTIKGEIEIKGEDTGPRKRKHRLHPRIVERIRQQKIQANPDLARTDQRKLRAEIVERHGAKKETV
jgi:hypothetical protein